jgi:hypothetical protein
LRKAMRQYVTWYLVAAMLVIGMTPKVQAGFSPSETIGLAAAERSSDLQRIQKFLEVKMVGERLKVYGFTPEEIQARLNSLTDQQIHQIALKIDDWKVGGDSGLGIIVAVLLIFILVVLIIQLTGYRIVVK